MTEITEAKKAQAEKKVWEAAEIKKAQEAADSCPVGAIELK